MSYVKMYKCTKNHRIANIIVRQNQFWNLILAWLEFSQRTSLERQEKSI